MPDAWETANSLDPNNSKDAWADPDQDNVLNLFEFQLNSNPNSNATPTVVDVSAGGDVVSAIGSAVSGQLIRVEAGTYTVNYMTFSSKTIMIQGGWNSTFTVRDPWATPTIFDGANTGTILYLSFSSGNDNIVVDGINMINGKESFGAFNFYISGNAKSNLCMKDCKITGSESTFSFGGAVNIMSKDSSYSEVFIVNTEITGNNSSGIYNQTVLEGVALWKIINCTVSGNSSTDLDEGYGIRGFTLDSVSNITIDIINSIIWGNQREAISFSKTGGPITINSSYSDIDNVYTGGTYNPGVTVINSDPMFVNPAGDFHLSAGSPCIDAGIDIGLPYLGAAPNMGVYEVVIAGISENIITEKTGIFPNPATKVINCESGDLYEGRCMVYDVTGTAVAEKTFTKNNFKLDVSRLSPGIYFLKIESKEGVSVKKFIKE